MRGADYRSLCIVGAHKAAPTCLSREQSLSPARPQRPRQQLPHPLARSHPATLPPCHPASPAPPAPPAPALPRPCPLPRAAPPGRAASSARPQATSTTTGTSSPSPPTSRCRASCRCAGGLAGGLGVQPLGWCTRCRACRCCMQRRAPPCCAPLAQAAAPAPGSGLRPAARPHPPPTPPTPHRHTHHTHHPHPPHTTPRRASTTRARCPASTPLAPPSARSTATRRAT
jgi:hypothetical protein